MTYTIRPAFGTVVRDVDGVIVAPCQSASDPAFVAYHDWLAAGNSPTLDETPNPPQTQTVTARQIRLALNQLGLRTAVENAVAAGSQNLKDEWQYSFELDINNPELIAMAGSMNADLGALFNLAATL